MAAGRPWAAVPAELAEAVRPRLHQVVPVVIAEIRAEVPEYDQPLEGEFGHLWYLSVQQQCYLVLPLAVALLGRHRLLFATTMLVLIAAVYRDIDRKRRSTRYLHERPLLVEPVEEIDRELAAGGGH